MEKRLSWGLTALEFLTPIAAFAMDFIVNPELSTLQSTLDTTINNSLLYFGLLIVSILLFGLSGKNFHTLLRNKKLSLMDKKLGLSLVILSWIAIIYLYFIPMFGILNSIPSY